jgi:hypothetical protein
MWAERLVLPDLTAAMFTEGAHKLVVHFIDIQLSGDTAANM